MRDPIHPDALLHQVLNHPVLPEDIYQDKYTTSVIDPSLHCDGMDHFSGMH